MSDLILVMSIGALLALGGYIALRSGVDEAGDRSRTAARLLVANFSSLLSWLAGSLALVYALQSLLRFPPVLNW